MDNKMRVERGKKARHNVYHSEMFYEYKSFEFYRGSIIINIGHGFEWLVAHDMAQTFWRNTCMAFESACT